MIKDEEFNTEPEIDEAVTPEGEISDEDAEGAAGGNLGVDFEAMASPVKDHSYVTYFVCINENCSGWGVDSAHKSNEHPTCPFCCQPLVIHQSGMVFVKHSPRITERKVPPKPRRK